VRGNKGNLEALQLRK